MKNRYGRKQAFTMIELIFTIVIIGVLGAFAVPQFLKTTASAKVNSEISTMNNLGSSLEWSKQNYVDIATPEWAGGNDGKRYTFDVDNDGFEEFYLNGKLANLHFENPAVVAASATSGTDSELTTMTVAAKGAAYATANTKGELFRKVSKDGGVGMRVVAYSNKVGVNGDDVLFLKGKASDTISGTEYPSLEDGGTNRDLVGKPDRNDFWVFNGTADSVIIDLDGDGAGTDRTTVPAYSTKLIDVNGTTDTTNTILGTVEIDDTATSVSTTGL